MTHSRANLQPPHFAQKSARIRSASFEICESGTSLKSARIAPTPTRRHAFAPNSIRNARTSSGMSNATGLIGRTLISRPVAAPKETTVVACGYTTHNRHAATAHDFKLNQDSVAITPPSQPAADSPTQDGREPAYLCGAPNSVERSA